MKIGDISFSVELSDDEITALPAQAAAKAFVIRQFNRSGISKPEFARRLGCFDMEARRILDPNHNTKLSTLDEAARVLGGRLSIGFEKVCTQ